MSFRLIVSLLIGCCALLTGSNSALAGTSSGNASFYNGTSGSVQFYNANCFVFARRRKHANLALVLGRLTEGGLMLLGVLVALVIAVPSFQPAQLIQILGISGVAIGFAFRDILQNFLAGILILLTEPFRIGDQIIVNNFEGTVEEIEARGS